MEGTRLRGGDRSVLTAMRARAEQRINSEAVCVAYAGRVMSGEIAKCFRPLRQVLCDAKAIPAAG